MLTAPPLASPGVRFTGASPVTDIQPVNGWALMSIADRDGDGFHFAEYIARGQVRDVHLDVSRFRSEFTATQQRFAWLAEAGFPCCPAIGPWSNRTLDAAIARDDRRAAA